MDHADPGTDADVAPTGRTRGGVGRVAGAMRRPLRGLRMPRRRRSRPGARPGVDLDQLTSPQTGESPRPVRVTCIDYGPDRVQRREVDDLPAFLDQPRPENAAVRWLNVDGLTDGRIIKALAEHYHLHPLALEDVLHVHQRTKAETYAPSGAPASGASASGAPASHAPPEQTAGDLLFVVTRMLRLDDDQLDSQQISMFLGSNFVLTLQEQPGDVFDPIRQRIDRGGSSLRQNDASFLLYALLDAIVDHCFPVLEHYADELEQMEVRVLEDANGQIIHAVHDLKRELMLLRRDVWPMRELVYQLQRDHETLLSETARLYVRDVHDHALQVIDLIEAYREAATGLADTYVNVVSNRMNEVMKILTMIASVFIPISFLAGVFGMNFESLPGQKSHDAFVYFSLACLAIAGGMAAWFKKKKWW